MTMIEVIMADEAMPLPTLAEFQERILAAIGAGAAVTLDLSPLVRLDLGFVQLVAAARAYAQARGVALALAAPAPAPVEAVLRRAGFLADPASDDTAFWLHGANR